jgi:hypothetical protein
MGDFQGRAVNLLEGNPHIDMTTKTVKQSKRFTKTQLNQHVIKSGDHASSSPALA